MEKYDYLQAVINSVDSYIRGNIYLDDYRGRRDELERELKNNPWRYSDMTGCSSGSYFCNSWKAEEAICHNFDLLRKALGASENGKLTLTGCPESWDMVIRCYVLPDAIHELLDDLEEKGFFLEEDENENRYY